MYLLLLFERLYFKKFRDFHRNLKKVWCYIIQLQLKGKCYLVAGLRSSIWAHFWKVTPDSSICCQVADWISTSLYWTMKRSTSPDDCWCCHCNLTLRLFVAMVSTLWGDCGGSVNWIKTQIKNCSINFNIFAIRTIKIK